MYRQFAEQLDQLGRAQIERIKVQAEKTTLAVRASENAAPSQGEEPLAFKARRAALAAKAEAQRAELKTLSRQIPDETDSQIAVIRAKLASAIAADHAARPADLDGNVMRLLDSGILKPEEYATLLNDATTATMRRVIGAAAGRRAAELQTADPAAAALLRNVENAGRRCDGSHYLVAFDAMADAIKRTTRNSGMCRHLDRLLEPLLKEFD